MAEYSIINFSKVVESKRLDAEYYRPLFVNFEKKHPSPLHLSDYVESGYRVVYENTEVFENSSIGIDTRFLQAADVHTPIINLDSVGYVLNSDWARYKKGRINSGEILIEVKGNAEKVALVPDDFPKKTLVTGTLYKIEVQSSKSKEYLLAYLISKYGVAFRNRVKTNLMVSFINKNDLYNIPVPTPSPALETKVSEYIKKSIQKNTLARSIFKQAESLLLQAVNLNNYTPDNANIAIRPLKECLSDNRFDAEYWQPKYDDIENKIKTSSFDTLGDIVNWKKGIEVGSVAYEEKGVPFLRISNLSSQEITNNDQKYISPELYETLKDNFSPQKNEILFSKDGTAGIAHRLIEDIAGIVSGGILRLTVTDPNISPDYLTVCLNSLLVQMQVERYCGGSIIQHLKTSDFEKIVVPVLDKTKQKEIADTAYQSRIALDEAKTFIRHAKRAVEVFIEQDEQAALASI